MATRRIKDITNTATTFASDDFIALDGSTQGTRKMDKDDLIAEVSAGVSGDYLEEANNLSDVASLDTSKLNMEIPDVGTAPNEVPLNGMLGDMAFQSSDGVSAAKIEVESTTGTATTQALTVTDGSITNFVVQEDGKVGVGNSAPDVPLDVSGATAHTEYAHFSNNNQRHLKLSSYSVSGNINAGHNINASSSVGALSLSTGGTTAVTIDSSQRVGIGNNSPGSYANGGADDLVIGDATGSRGITISTGSAETGSLYFGDDVTSGAPSYRGMVRYVHASNQLQFATQSSIRWYISSSGDLVANGAHGIDFGSAATSAGQGTGTTGTPANSVLSDYEYGSWTPTIAPSGGSFTSITMDVQSATYVKVGRMVHCQAYIRTDGLDTTGASGSVRVTGLPFVNSGSSNYAAVSVGLSRNWVTNPAGGYVNNGVASLTLTKRTTSSTELIEMEPADMTTGSGTDKNAVLMSFQYIAST